MTTHTQNNDDETDDSWFMKWLDGYNAIIQPLFSDLHCARNGLKHVDQEFWRRIYIRALFATIEADIFQRKQLALMGHGDTYVFSTAELTVLRELQYNVQNNGAINESAKFVPLAANYRLSFKLAAKVIGSQFELDCSGRPWQDFLDCIQIRNRITHPKTGDDIVVTKADAELAKSVADWWAPNMPAFLRAAITA